MLDGSGSGALEVAPTGLPTSSANRQAAQAQLHVTPSVGAFVVLPEATSTVPSEQAAVLGGWLGVWEKVQWNLIFVFVSAQTNMMGLATKGRCTARALPRMLRRDPQGCSTREAV